MQVITRFIKTMSAAALVLSAWVLVSADATAQSSAYDRLGTLHAGIQCLTWDDTSNETWTLEGPLAGTVPINMQVRIIGTATPGTDPGCAASDGFLQVTSVIIPGLNPGTPFCFGDGGDGNGCTNCPCTNEALPGSGGGCLNSTGGSAKLNVDGTDRLSAADLCFRMEGGPPGSFSILQSGTAQAPTNPANPCFTQNPGSGAQSAFFDGLRCAVTSTIRHGGRTVDVNGEVGILTNPWGFCSPGFPGNNAFVAGQTRYFQAIYRDLDTAVCQTGLNTTQGIAVTFTP